MLDTRLRVAWIGVVSASLCACGQGDDADPIGSSGAAVTTSYEAESAVLNGGSVATQHAGYSGTGYATFTGGSGSHVEWTVSVTAAATHPVVIRFANGSGSSYSATASANGGARTSFSLPTTGSWSSWTTKSFNLRLDAGTNRIRLAAGSSRGLPNVDRIDITEGGASSFTLELAVAGSGTISPPAGTHAVAAGTAVSLSAVPATGHIFQGWSGSATGSSATTSLVMDGDKSVTATFVPRAGTHTLTVNVVGAGSTSPAAGSHTHAAGTTVGLTATPSRDWRFQGWSGDASGTSPVTSVVMNGPRSVVATFVPAGPVDDSGAIGFANDGRPITGGAAGPTVFVGSEAELQQYSDVDAPYTIFITRSFPLTGMDTHIRSNKTVIGQGNVTLSGGGLYLFRASNVIIRNLTIVGSEEDSIGLHFSDHVWIDHCTLADPADGNIDITQASDYITVSWCKFHYTVDNGHNFVNLIASSDADNGSQYHVTFHHNWWATGSRERMPSVRFGRVHVFNNYYNVPGNNYAIRTRVGAELRVENNFFENVRNPWERYITGSGTQGKLFASGNNVGFLETTSGVTWTGDVEHDDGTRVVMVPGTDSVFTAPYPYALDRAADVKARVMAGAGAGAGPFAP